MAGAGYRNWTAGENPTAAQFDTYLQEQTVMVFDDAADRTTQLSGVAAQGMTSYVKDKDRFEIHDGTYWQPVGTRIGGTWTRAANQSCTGADAVTTISWDTEVEDSDGFATTGTTITIPANLGGLYVITTRLIGQTTSWAAGSFIRFLLTGSAYDRGIAESAYASATFTTLLLAAGTIQVQMSNAGSTQNAQGELRVYRITP